MRCKNRPNCFQDGRRDDGISFLGEMASVRHKHILMIGEDVCEIYPVVMPPSCVRGHLIGPL